MCEKVIEYPFKKNIIAKNKRDILRETFNHTHIYYKDTMINYKI